MLLLFFSALLINADASTLSEEYTITKGDYIAMQMNFYSAAAWGSLVEQTNTNVFAYYDPLSNRVYVELYGISDTPEAAQAVMSQFLNVIKGNFIPALKRWEGIELLANEFTIVYRNRTEEGHRKIFMWEDNKYKFPIGK
ncbi:hypothetical protein A2Y85_03085 [candidate division WOR-3 bacterium RBG_13_43_14]|uniref:Uncharacterized protein n=1 Tax=candidate division WOR-3 bacterium RBG_13_43_14 TaxID=1802590 RepID=A0A1F4UDN6_UNCW3|nr:MAG: hypothetical protein A2Y85_03085 [candidate division WOR-3 bacterium RBG_13_43_14]